ncbi:uncharacterized protein ATNIH1004_010707 [Aspergillus tanneri]|uniref:Uncharacterized protein n=1 Tax=Aspergillus tanneri TaxID=1220188 RepID=A0A5M9M4S4_9EURO|nr:uncharacterized protein ATNIH1004_010707 [Aspergillus tanneri]KAA8641768.1 hypothetical protein ATNIH1004_010707 [Aspergillus tanneri]
MENIRAESKYVEVSREEYLSLPSLSLCDNPDKEDQQKAEWLAERAERRVEFQQKRAARKSEENETDMTSYLYPTSTRSFRDGDGMLSKDFSTSNVDSANSIPRGLSEFDGTIRQFVYTYKYAAHPAMWKVRLYYSSSVTDIHSNTETLAGWIALYESVNPMKLQRSVRAINNPDSDWCPGAVSNGNKHIDKDVDFESHFNEWIAPIIGDGRVGEAMASGQYFMAIDAESWGLEALRACKK